MDVITKKGCNGRKQDLGINSFFWLEQPCIGLSFANIYPPSRLLGKSIANMKTRWSLNSQGCMITRHATGPGSWSAIMNVLALIQARLNKAARIAAAQKASLVYRGVPYAKA